MSLWQEHQLAERITEILKDVPEYAPHHLGYPYMSAYQIAIELACRYPEILRKTGYLVGGAGSGDRNTLSQYLARELSNRIHTGKLPHIEGGFISNWHLHDMQFDNQGQIFHSSHIGTPFTLSLYRYKP